MPALITANPSTARICNTLISAWWSWSKISASWDPSRFKLKIKWIYHPWFRKRISRKFSQPNSKTKYQKSKEILITIRALFISKMLWTLKFLAAWPPPKFALNFRRAGDQKLTQATLNLQERRCLKAAKPLKSQLKIRFTQSRSLWRSPAIWDCRITNLPWKISGLLLLPGAQHRL